MKCQNFALSAHERGTFPFSFTDCFLTFMVLSMLLKNFNIFLWSVQDFVPFDLDGKKVGMYCCGLIVYDFVHIGNWWTFVFGDLVRRYLQFKGYDVHHVMNITDVDDKIIKCVRESKTSLQEFTSKFETAFFEVNS